MNYDNLKIGKKMKKSRLFHGILWGKKIQGPMILRHDDLVAR
jgi:hypothetical protein